MVDKICRMCNEPNFCRGWLMLGAHRTFCLGWQGSKKTVTRILDTNNVSRSVYRSTCTRTTARCVSAPASCSCVTRAASSTTSSAWSRPSPACHRGCGAAPSVWWVISLILRSPSTTSAGQPAVPHSLFPQLHSQATVRSGLSVNSARSAEWV